MGSVGRSIDQSIDRNRQTLGHGGTYLPEVPQEGLAPAARRAGEVLSCLLGYGCAGMDWWRTGRVDPTPLHVTPNTLVRAYLHLLDLDRPDLGRLGAAPPTRVAGVGIVGQEKERLSRPAGEQR